MYDCEEGIQTCQNFTYSVADQGLLAILPDPLMCFDKADYKQTQVSVKNLLSNDEIIMRPWKGAYLFSPQFPCRHIMVSLEFLPYYLKDYNHIWHLYTLGVGKIFWIFWMLKFDLRTLPRSYDQKQFFKVQTTIIAVQKKLLDT